MTQKRTRSGLSRLLAMLMFSALAFAIPAHAATTTVDCTGLDDISTVQDAVDTASNGDTIVLSGVCNFALSLPHGGDQTSIESAAVVIRPGAPINGLTVMGDGSPLTLLVGNALNTAFYIAPGNNNVTIKALTMVDFARPIVTQSNSGTTIGESGVTPSPNGIHVIGGPLLDSAILALAHDRGFSDPAGTVTVSYGILGENTATFPASGLLTNLKIAGNYITYGPVGIPTPVTDVIGIDVRQKNSGNGRDITIENNAVGFLSVVFLNFNINGIRVHAHSGDPNYHMTGVTIQNNNLGRLDELPDPLADINAAGRAGLVVVRTSNLVVANNKVKAFETPMPIPMPGGAIILSDVTDGTVTGNDTKVFGDLLTPESDLGGIGVVDDINTLFGFPAGDPPSTRITVNNNTIGSFPIEGIPLLGAIRGIVVNGTSLAQVTNNNVLSSTEAALNIGVDVQGPGDIGSPGPISLVRTVTSSLFCNNTLDGILDDPNEVEFGGGAASVSNSFPGGSLFSGNGECGPKGIKITETNGDTRVTEGSLTADTYGVSLTVAPCGNVTVTLTPDIQVTASPLILTFTPLNWSVPQTVSVLAVDDLLVEGTHFGFITHTAAGGCYTGVTATLQVIVFDNEIGLFTVNPPFLVVYEGGACDKYTVVLNVMPTDDVIIKAFGDPQVWIYPPVQRTFTTLNWNIPQDFTVCAVDDTIRETPPQFGLVTMTATSNDIAFNGAPVPSVLALVIDNDKPLPPVFTVPTLHVCSDTVIFTGTGEAGALVEIFENNAVIATATVAANGLWTAGPVGPLTPGTHVVAARQTGIDGLVSTMTVKIFQVILAPPSVPVILVPVDGSTVDSNNVTISGVADPLTAVAVLIGGIPVAQTTADVSGNWSLTLYLQAGTYAITAVSSNGCFVSAESSATTFDVVVPLAPTIITPAEGSVNPATILVSGTAPDGTTVRLVEGGRVIASGIPVASGSWSISLTFSGGPHTIVAFAQTATAISPPSAPRSFTVDDQPPHIAIRPSFPYIPIVSLKVYVPLLESFIVEGTANDNLAVDHIELQYTALLLGSDATVPVAACPNCPGPQVDWSDDTALDPGLYEVSGIAVDTVGNKSDPQTLLFLWVV